MTRGDSTQTFLLALTGSPRPPHPTTRASRPPSPDPTETSCAAMEPTGVLRLQTLTFSSDTPEWRNWQTRRTQTPLSVRTCGFESHLGYRQRSTPQRLFTAAEAFFYTYGPPFGRWMRTSEFAFATSSALRSHSDCTQFCTQCGIQNVDGVRQEQARTCFVDARREIMTGVGYQSQVPPGRKHRPDRPHSVTTFRTGVHHPVQTSPAQPFRFLGRKPSEVCQRSSSSIDKTFQIACNHPY